jgi:hypothetical protein
MGAIPGGMGALKIILCANGPHAQKNLERAVTEWMSASSEGVSTLEPMAVAPLPASVGGSEKPVDWERGLGTRPLSESVLKALAQELESAGKRDPLPWYRPHPDNPPLPRIWGSEDDERLQTVQSLAHTPQFDRLWKHLEPDQGPCIPVLELIPGDGDCLYTAVSRYLEMNRSGPVPVASLRLFVANSLKADPLKYVAWGVLVDQESPAETVAAYADALREPRSANGGQLELHIMPRRYINYEVGTFKNIR